MELMQFSLVAATASKVWKKDVDTMPPQPRLSNCKYQWTSVLSRHIVTEMIGRLPLLDELQLRSTTHAHVFSCLLYGYMDAASCELFAGWTKQTLQELKNSLTGAWQICPLGLLLPEVERHMWHVKVAKWVRTDCSLHSNYSIQKNMFAATTPRFARSQSRISFDMLKSLRRV